MVGPLRKTALGCQYILVIIDYANRYLEAASLRSVKATAIAVELLQLFAHVGFPVRLTDVP